MQTQLERNSKLRAANARKRDALKKLLGGKCNKCGSLEKLQFDHIDPTTKSFNIATNLRRSLESLIVEVKKCQLLCSPCHTAKTLEDLGLQRSRHGTVAYYNKYKCRCFRCSQAKTNYYRKRSTSQPFATLQLY